MSAEKKRTKSTPTIEEPKIRIMVASTVIGFQDQLSSIVAQLNTLGYHVLNSHKGTVKVDPTLSNLENCLKAVEECDIFLGIIRPFYGTGNIGDKNITFEEIKYAIELKKPYWFLVHRDVVFARLLSQKITPNLMDVEIARNNFFDRRSINIYEYVIKNHVEEVILRNGNWAQEFWRLDEVMDYINTQFSDIDFVKGVMRKIASKNGK